MSHILYFDTSAAIHLRSPSSPPDASRAPFPHRSPRTAFNRRSMRRFEASPRRATPKGHKTFINCTAPPSPGPTYTTQPPAFVAHDPVQIPTQIGLEVLHRHLVHTRRTLVGLHLPIRLPDLPLGDLERLPC